jgi:hypothetical protein
MDPVTWQQQQQQQQPQQQQQRVQAAWDSVVCRRIAAECASMDELIRRINADPAWRMASKCRRHRRLQEDLDRAYVSMTAEHAAQPAVGLTESLRLIMDKKRLVVERMLHMHADLVRRQLSL